MWRVKEKITERVFDCVVDVGKNIMTYLNVVLHNVAFEHIFLTFKPGVDYNRDSLKILNHEGVLSLHKGSTSGNVSSWNRCLCVKKERSCTFCFQKTAE